VKLYFSESKTVTGKTIEHLQQGALNFNASAKVFFALFVCFVSRDLLGMKL